MMTTEFDVEAIDLSGVLNTSPEQKAKQLPDPKTFRLLCVVPEAMEEFADSEIGIIKSSQSMMYEEVLTPVLFVVKMGPDAYKDTSRFPSGPSCKEGDFVVVRPNSGTRLKIHGREFRIINDDSVEAVVEDPRGISRAS
jgi:co-chaperonin GroES (HSP10)|uniref:Co-chaperonin GroES n=1 Tax=uncultured virus TaxID=340016 RepID=A0A221S434_9VIRU|nr:co-chaperonin GroES [uncultured virus]